jgi:peptidoglycan-associated lipoprotein
MMRFKILCMVAATALVAACSHKPQEAASTATNTDTAPPPAQPAAVSPADELKNQVGDRIFFSFDKSDISGEAKEILTRQSAFASKYPDLTFTVEGHCDERGTREYNLALGERRATAVKNVLVALGIPAARIQTISYGKERPIVVGSSEDSDAQNRVGITTVNGG